MSSVMLVVLLVEGGQVTAKSSKPRANDCGWALCLASRSLFIRCIACELVRKRRGLRYGDALAGVVVVVVVLNENDKQRAGGQYGVRKRKQE